MTGKQRLKVLANYLVSGAVDEDRFRMSKWPSCAVGEGTRLPSLRKEGLTMRTNSDGTEVPQYDGYTCFTACAQFFKLPYDTAHKFFNGSPRRAVTVGRQLLSYLKRH